ncbi:MAG: DUF4381 domain-containing protein [Gammaproteobacteria bacterium]|nr:DUF4381 domain-containing protein [Gammaproteobacteria bacterium]
MDPLHDIRGIDPAPWWPLAPGWWLILLGALLFALLIWWLWRQRRLYPLGRWQKDARQRLVRLKRQLQHAPTKEVASELSELLRRIAIARCGRAKTAALSGQAWLAWLANNDRSGFDWQANGQLLLQLPYAPPDRDSDRDKIRNLIDAAIRWVSEEACHV